MERALFDQANLNNICLIENWIVDEPKTKKFKNLINQVAPKSKKVLAISDSFDDKFVLASRNLSTARIGRAQDLSPLDIVQSDQIVISLKGLDVLIAKLGAKGTKS
jgi:ribosomal protein L4